MAARKDTGELRGVGWNAFTKRAERGEVGALRKALEGVDLTAE